MVVGALLSRTQALANSNNFPLLASSLPVLFKAACPMLSRAAIRLRRAAGSRVIRCA